MVEEIKFDLSELHKMEKENGRKYDYVRLSVADTNGVSRTNVVPRRHLETNLTDGFLGCAAVLSIGLRDNLVVAKELKEFGFGNFEYWPCKGTLHNCSWVGLNEDKGIENKVKWLVGEVICEMKWPLRYREGSFVEACPRYALRKQLDKLQNLGYILKSAFEVEYVLLKSGTFEPVFDEKDVAATQVHAKFENYLYTIERNCEKSGLDISALRIEHGKGQFELVMVPQFGVKTCDDVFYVKEAIKEMSASMGYLASFMTLPFEDLSTNGFHLNLSLWKHSIDGNHTNAFYDGNDPDHLSSTFRHFLAGLIKHGKALTAFCCPTVNCYKRLHTFMQPHKMNWTFDDRSVTYRIKKGGESSTYLENRLPSSACNPYFATAATLAAGLDGILNKLILPEKCNDQINFDHFEEIKMEEADKTIYLPFSLEEALNELEKDEVLKEGLGEELVRWFVKLKRKSEVEVIRHLDNKSRWSKERELFLEFI